MEVNHLIRPQDNPLQYPHASSLYSISTPLDDISCDWLQPPISSSFFQAEPSHGEPSHDTFPGRHDAADGRLQYLALEIPGMRYLSSCHPPELKFAGPPMRCEL